MKKYMLTLSVIFITLNLWCVWEGNGVAGVATDFQEDGMFVKSSLFPKYTLIEIINLENDTKVRAIVLEGKETPGILLTFSPSVAEELKVQYGSVVRVRLSSPSLVEEDIPREDNVAKEKNENLNESLIGKLEETVIGEEENLIINKDDKVEEKNEDATSSSKKDEVVLYDFKPIAKNVEKKDKNAGGVSFAPAFIEEEVKIDIKIPNKINEENERKEVVKVEERQEKIKIEEKKVEEPPVIKAKEVPPITKEEEKKAPIIKEPKVVSIPVAKKVYLEDVPPRPPKEVLSPKVEKKEMIDEKIEAVPSVSEIVRKKEPKEEDANNVNVLPTKNKEKKESTEESKTEEEVIKANMPSIVNVGNDIALHTKDEDVKDVIEAPPIKEKNEEASYEEVASVEEVETPRKNEEEKEIPIIEDVEEVEEPKHVPVEKKEEVIKVKDVGGIIENHHGIYGENPYIRPVEEVECPKEKEELKQDDINKDVPIVDAIKKESSKVVNLPMEDEPPKDDEPPVEEEPPKNEESPVEEEPPKNEESPVEEEPPKNEEPPVEEAPKEDEPTIKEEPPKEDMSSNTAEESTTKELNERPLKEIDVRKRNNIEEEPSKEKNEINSNKDIVAIEEDNIGHKEEKQKDVEENALKEISVSNTQDKIIGENASKEDIKIEKTQEEVKKDIPTKEDVKEEMPTEEIKKEDTEPKKSEVKREETKIGKEESIVDIQIEEGKSPAKEFPIDKKPIMEENSEPKKHKDLQEKIEEPKKEKPLRKNVSAQDIDDFPIGHIIKGYSYVQIAVYGNPLRVKDILKKYSAQYPIVIEKRYNKYGHNYVVFVGPLQKDEVGAIQERFRSFGFVDAF